MTSKELKIGNYIEVEGVMGVIVAIKNNLEIDLEVKIPQEQVINVKSANTSPVRLNCEFLIKNCQFDDQGRITIGLDKDRYYLKIKDSYNYIMLVNKKNEPIIHFWDVRYLHMLQNLFFVLKGKEMPVNLIDSPSLKIFSESPVLFS